MLCRGIAVMNADGEPVRLVGSQSDITDRKVAEEQLRISEERYALAAQGANATSTEGSDSDMSPDTASEQDALKL